jgi:uncharacterized membrane protein
MDPISPSPATRRHFWPTFLTGLFTLLPVFLTFYSISWFTLFVEKTLRGLFLVFTPEPLYFPGLGLVASFIGIFIVGLLMRTILMQQIYQRLEWALESVPLLKSIYAAIRDFVGFVAHSRDRQSSQVVLVRLDAIGANIVGLVTRSDLEGFAPPLGGSNLVAVYIPMSYQLGGYTLLIARERIQPVDMKVEEALGYAITGWVRQPQSGRSGTTSV